MAKMAPLFIRCLLDGIAGGRLPMGVHRGAPVAVGATFVRTSNGQGVLDHPLPGIEWRSEKVRAMHITIAALLKGPVPHLGNPKTKAGGELNKWRTYVIACIVTASVLPWMAGPALANCQTAEPDLEPVSVNLLGRYTDGNNIEWETFNAEIINHDDASCWPNVPAESATVYSVRFDLGGATIQGNQPLSVVAYFWSWAGVQTQGPDETITVSGEVQTGGIQWTAIGVYADIDAWGGDAIDERNENNNQMGYVAPPPLAVLGGNQATIQLGLINPDPSGSVTFDIDCDVPSGWSVSASPDSIEVEREDFEIIIFDITPPEEIETYETIVCHAVEAGIDSRFSWDFYIQTEEP